MMVLIKGRGVYTPHRYAQRYPCFNLVLIEVTHFMFVSMGAETQFVYAITSRIL
jgi:hypothetical protein